MSESSDTEEFYDAEDNTPIHGTRKSRKPSKETEKKSIPIVSEDDGEKDKIIEIEKQDSFNFQPPLVLLQGGRKKFKEIRQKLTDDEDVVVTNNTPPNSTSSIEGVYASGTKTSHPFRVIEHDTVSLQSYNSLLRAGRIPNIPDGSIISETKRTASASALSNSSHDSSTTSSKNTSEYPSTITLSTNVEVVPIIKQKECLPLQEPDVIASTKASCSKIAEENEQQRSKDVPIAPPRRKKKLKRVGSSQSLTPSLSADSFSVVQQALSSPTSTIESLTKEFECSLDKGKVIPKSQSDLSENKSKSASIKSGYSLDIKQISKGQFVVKAQNDYVQENEESNKTSRGSASRSSIGHYSLGPHRTTNKKPALKVRRRSAGDENMLKQINLSVRTRTDSGKQLTDLEILEQVTVLNLDTGERIPLSVAEDKLPQCINPLSLHIMRLTSEYVSSSSMEKEKESDEESVSSKQTVPLGKVRRRTERIKRFLGSTVRKTVDKAKSIAQEVSHARHKEDVVDLVDEVHPGEQNIKLKASNSHKGPYEFEKIQHVQEFNEHEGPIWCMKFSQCGRLLATAGQDKVLRIFVIKSAFTYFQDMRTKYNAEKVSPTPSQESLVSHHSSDNSGLAALDALNSDEANKLIFMPKPFCTYTGHTSDLLDVSWSKNYFILSSSMDKTVRLWHISRKECLCCFQHIDFVTAIVFHPRDDRYFLSGSLDGKIRLWNIPDKKVAVWTEVEGNPKLITAANFCQNGKFAVIGSYDGRCIFYTTEHLKYHTQIHVKSSRGRNSTGRKISGIESMPGEDKILITSNDSRIRLYDLRDLNLSCKYKGYANVSSQIKASFSHDGKYIVSGSENRDIYIWRTNHDYSKFSSVRRDRNDFWEAIKAHNAVVTCAIFAPNPDAIIKMIDEEKNQNEENSNNEKVNDPVVEQRTKGCGGYVLVSADYNGCIKIFINKMKPKHSSLPASALA
ncbi:WD repeat-containing protein 44 isoform X2 [Onthophagus taurus]|uniref:WD repeat-containing protein 44 isoform X2 n=1 Tax=Onthophagus taurus TaxID=166361 RepID=UPI000C20ECF9|nr:WD repeat-containing protein 44-like isoform X2 [Onthophagus taurus]